MSALSAHRSGGLSSTDGSSSLPNAPNLISGGSEPTAFVPIGHTLSDISNIRIPIETALAAIPKNTPNKQELANAVHASITGCQELLGDTTQVSATTKACADDLYRHLEASHIHLQDRQAYGKRAQIKGKVNSLFGRSAISPPTTYHLEVQAAFDALKNSLLPSTVMALQSDLISSRLAPVDAGTDLQDNAAGPALSSPATSERASPADDRPPEEPIYEIATNQALTDAPKKVRPWTTIVDAVEGGLGLLSSVTDFIPTPAGPIVKLMAGTGLTIIEMLKDMAGNQEEAMDLGRYVGTLIQIAGRFLERSEAGTAENCDAKTAKQLQSFLDALKTLEANLVKLKSQGRFKQGVSHKTNKDDLKQWETVISRAFATLQTQLSLDSIRLLTKMDASDALRERDRLIGLLGDGDIGATEKASDVADLMCLPGTRTEILDRVDQWISDPSGSRIFWISGVAGCGKSAVAATIAGRPRAVPTSIAVFYFVRGNQERNKRVICSLSRQLARFGHGSLEHFVLGSVKAQPDIATSHLATQFQHLIVDPLKKLVPGSSPVILVVDALDEWDNYGAVLKLVELIKQTHVKLPPAIRFVLTSRNEPHLVRSLDSDSMKPLVTRYPLDAVLKSDAGKDIRRYIEERFAKLCDEFTIVAEGKAWPEAGDIDTLVILSDGLFQWAATVMSYIGAMGPVGRLRNILKNPERYQGLDNLYQGVLDMSSREEMDERVPHLLQNVLGAILTAPIPITATAIAYLCCEDADTLQETLELIQQEVLPRLASMFIIPKDPMQPITISHKSVLDYLTSQDRCTDPRFYADLVVHNDLMLNACFRLMESNLKRDICGINDPSKLNEEVQDMVERHISPGLRHACQHWDVYLRVTSNSVPPQLLRRLGDFVRKHVLHWLEVMGLIGLTEEAISIARDVELWLLAFPTLSLADQITQQLWSDTKRFATMFSDPISTAAAHIYISAFHLTPNETQLARQFTAIIGRGVQVAGGLLGKHWPPPTWIGRGHTDVVVCASFSPDGRKILSGSHDKSLRIWNAESGAENVGALKGHTSFVACGSFSPDGRTILSGSWDRTLRIWDAESSDQKGETMKGHTGTVCCAAFSPDGKTVLSGSIDNTLRLWDAKLGTQKGGTLKGHTNGVRCISFSPDGRSILSGSNDRTLRLWDAESGAQKSGTLKGHTGTVCCASFSPDGKTILSGSSDKTLRFWGVESGAQKGGTSKAHAAEVWCASFSPDGRTILFGLSDHTLRLWDAESGTQKGRTLQGHTDYVRCASFSPDGRTVLSGSSDKTLRTWDVDSGALRTEPRNGHLRGVSCFAFSPDGGTIISGSYDKTVRLWDTETGILKAEPLSTEGAISDLSFSDDGLMLIGKMFDDSSLEWDFTKHVRANSDPARREPVFKGSVSPGGWVFHRDIRWFWMPFYYADWLLCGSRLAVRNERVVYIIDVSEIMYIVE